MLFKRSAPRLPFRLLFFTLAVIIALPAITAGCIVRPAPTSITTVIPTGTTSESGTGPSDSGTSQSEPGTSLTESTGTTGSESSGSAVSDPSTSGTSADGSQTSQSSGDPSGTAGFSETGTSGSTSVSTSSSAPTQRPGTTGTTGTNNFSTGFTTNTTPWTTGTPRPTTVTTALPPTTSTTRAPTTTTTRAPTTTTTRATTQATTVPTTQGSTSNFPVKNYGSFPRSSYGTNASIVTSEDGVVSIDVGSTRRGVVLVKINSGTSKAWKCLLKGPSGSYQYDLLKRGVYEGVPLQMGSGAYKLTVYEQISGTSFATHTAHSFNVSLSSSLSPYTASSIIVDFSSGSASTAKAKSLVSGKTNQVARIEAIYNWVVDNIAYDRVLAGKITSKEVKTYIPDPDKTMSSRKGICYDYAALMAAMLRSQGIPTRLIMGLVPQGYHAWNEVYLAGTGWVVIASFNYRQVDGSAWVMFDPTFAAGNMSEEKILNTTHTKQRTY